MWLDFQGIFYTKKQSISWKKYPFFFVMIQVIHLSQIAEALQYQTIHRQ